MLESKNRSALTATAAVATIHKSPKTQSFRPILGDSAELIAEGIELVEGLERNLSKAGRRLQIQLVHEFHSLSEMLPCHSRESGPFDYTQNRTEQYRMCRNLYR